nr:NADH dehydrogenase subunit 2 [Nogodinidae sp.]
MKMNLTKMSMLMMMIMSTMMILSSNNMLFSWMSMEINLIVFMPLITKSKKMTDQSMKYFIVQSLSSSMMLMSMLINSTIEYPINSSIMLMTSMLMKTGMIPFHLWMISMMQSMTWENCLLFSTWQKIAPTIMMSQIMSMKSMMLPMILSLLYAPISAMKQLSTKKIMAYSSISNSTWMILSAMMSKMMFMMFMWLYSMLNMILMKTFKMKNIMFINQMNKMNTKNSKMSMIMNMMSISGMPPLAGFFPKWMILQTMSSISMTMSTSMIISSMMSTFIYMKMTSIIVMESSTKKKSLKKEKMLIETSITLNMLGMPAFLILKSI